MERIRILLDLYYKAETNEEEELELRRYFTGDNVPDDLLDDRDIFMSFGQLAGIEEPSAGLAERIKQAVGQDEDQTWFMTHRLFSVVAGIAATMLVLLATYIFISKENAQRDTFTDPEIAYAETMKILYGISASLNSGINDLEPVGKLFRLTEESLKNLEKPSGIIEEKMKPIRKFNDAIEIAGELVQTQN